MRFNWIHDLIKNVPEVEHGVKSPSTLNLNRQKPSLESGEKVQQPGRTFSRTRVRETDRLREELAQAAERITELARSQVELTSTIARLNERASTDVLTGLNNRRRFDEALEANFSLAIRKQSPLSVVMIDVDSFKSYNDTHGHAAGDLVLSAISKLLLRSCTSDQVAGRYGGEEFAIVLPGSDPAQALDFAEQQRSFIEAYPWPLRGVTASFGVATLGRTITDPADLMRQADRALYYSKSQGRNRVTHFQNLNIVPRSPGGPSDPPPVPHPGTRTPPRSESAGDAVAPPRKAETGESAAPAMASVRKPTPKRLTLESSAPDAASVALNRFVQELWDGKQPPQQYRAAFLAIKEGIEADLVFLCSQKEGRILEIVGDRSPNPQWCQDVVEALSRELAHGGLWERPEGAPGFPLPDGSNPSAALVVRVEGQHPSWLVALRFDHVASFVAADLRLVRMVWQLQIDKKRHSHVYDGLKETLFGIVRCLSTALDAKDPYTCGHSERVARIAVHLGRQMKLPSGEISDLYLAGLLHDVGKIGIRDDVLLKPGPLTADEFAHIQEHPGIGERIIANVSRLAYIRPGVRGHHERFDGRGYPDGLSGQEIPLMARILAVADACDAMMSARRYRPQLSQNQIEQYFRDGAGTQWDPEIIEHFIACRHELYAVHQRGLGQSVYMAVSRAAGDDGEEDGMARSIDRISPAAQRN